MTGRVMVNDEVENVQGVRHITTETELLMPIIPWEALSDDGVTVDACYPSRIKFVGPIDEEDFAQGYVLTFPKDEYLSLGCPLPPVTDELSKMDEVIFRKITEVKLVSGGIRVKTLFVSGANVAPKVMVHIGELVSPTDRILERRQRLLNLNGVSRVNDIGITAFDESGTFDIASGVGLDWSIKATAGVCEFDFDRFPPKATWEQRVKVEVGSSLKATVSFEEISSGELLNVPIAGAGFNKKIFLVGTIRFGLFAKVSYDLALKATASSVASFSGSFETGQRVEVGIGKFDIDDLGSTSNGGVGGIDFTGPTVDVMLDVDGFAGVRPAIGAELSVPVIGDATAEIGATVGLQLDINYNNPPFQAVSAGTKLGSACESCHFVQGTLDLEGRRFSVEGKVPFLGSKEHVIRDSFLDLRLGTACAFATSCSSAT